MQILFNNALTTSNTVVSTEASGFPEANLFNYLPSVYWKATATSATITLTLTAAQQYAISFFNTNATTISVVYRTSTTPVYTASVLTDTSSGGYWVDSPGATTCDNVLITLSHASAAVYLGCLQAGIASAITFDDPRRVNEAYDDYSIVNRTKNQAMLYTQKDRVYRYDCDILADYAANGTIDLVAGVKAVQPYPMAVKLLETNYTRILYALAKASGNGDGKTRPTCKITLDEVVK